MDRTWIDGRTSGRSAASCSSCSRDGCHSARQQPPIPSRRCSRSQPDWTALPAATPTSVRHLIGRCLEKDRRQRLRDIGDAIPELAGERPETAASGPATQTQSSSSLWRPLAIVFATAALALAGYVAMSTTSPSTAPPASGPPATPLTSYPGSENTPTLSPDGSQIAFSWNGPAQDNFDIYFKLVGAGEPRQLTSHPAQDAKPAWSPNGARIAFLRFTSERAAELMVIPALGGAERRIATVYPVQSWDMPFPNLAWTPDGRWLAFGGALSRDGPRGIWLLAADGKENPEHRRVTEAPRDTDADAGDFSPMPSPDGTHMAFIRARTLSRGAVFVVPLTAGGAPAGSAAQLTPESWNVNGVAWTPDGRDLLFSWGGHLGLSRLSRIPATATPGGFAHPTAAPVRRSGHGSGDFQVRAGGLQRAIQRHGALRGPTVGELPSAACRFWLFLHIRRRDAALLT